MDASTHIMPGIARSSISHHSTRSVESNVSPYPSDPSLPDDVERAVVRANKTSDFPWLSQEFEPICTGGSRTPSQWLKHDQTVRRNNSVGSRSSGARESIENLSFIASDMDYYAGAVSDHPELYGQESDEDAIGNSEKDSDIESFGQIQIIRASDLKPSSSVRSRKSEKDINLVTWDGPGDPQNPKNWTTSRKWVATMTVSLLTFISPVSSSMIAPALPQIQRDLHISSQLEVELALSVFVLGFALGPLFLGPLSELFGRRLVLLFSGLFYFVFNLAAGFSNRSAEVIAFRFLSGLGGSAPLGIGGGVLADIWMPQERGKAMALYSLMPLLGPAVGPVAGGFIAQYSTWKWVFWSTSIVSIVFILMGAIFLKETYAPTILGQKKRELIKSTGNKDLRTEFDVPNRKFVTHISIALQRPFIMLFTQPIVQLLALYIGYLFGVLYLVLASFPQVWSDNYNEKPAIAGLNYLSLGVGFFLGTQVAARFADRIYKHLKARGADGDPAGLGRSEFRVPLMFPGALMVPIGLVLYGWSAQRRTHWIVPNIGAAIFAAGNQLVFQNCQTYLVDAYTRYAASAIAATAVLRSLGGFAFLLFAPAMYRRLGYGWGNTTLALVGVVVGLPVPAVLWWYGERLRRKSTFAAG